jgi:hypothetical protein
LTAIPPFLDHGHFAGATESSTWSAHRQTPSGGVAEDERR